MSSENKKTHVKLYTCPVKESERERETDSHLILSREKLHSAMRTLLHMFHLSVEILQSSETYTLNPQPKNPQRRPKTL